MKQPELPREYLECLCLIIDDEVSMRRTIGNMMSRMGFDHILYADNGASALSFIQSSKIDLIICDINMPEMNGMELFRILRSNKKLSDMSFIFVTAEVRRNVVARAAEEGGGAYIIKPFVMATLEEKVLEILRRKFYPTKFEIHLKKFREYMYEFRIQEAEKEIREALEDDPESPSLRFYLGQILVHQGLSDMAIDYFKSAIERKPLFVKAYDALGKLYEDRGDTDAAVAQYEMANGISSSNAERLVALSKLHIKRGEPEKAMELLKKAAKDLNQDVSVSGQLIGELYMANGEYEKAMDVLDNAHKKNPSDCSIMKSLADAYRKNAKPQEALDTYKGILEIIPHNADIYHAMGKTYLEIGEKSTAIESITKAWEINPSSKEITKELRALAKTEKIKL
jgi:two-component system, chemotaxis family, chemotaxis protein CheY